MTLAILCLRKIKYKPHIKIELKAVKMLAKPNPLEKNISP